MDYLFICVRIVWSWSGWDTQIISIINMFSSKIYIGIMMHCRLAFTNNTKVLFLANISNIHVAPNYHSTFNSNNRKDVWSRNGSRLLACCLVPSASTSWSDEAPRSAVLPPPAASAVFHLWLLYCVSVSRGWAEVWGWASGALLR